MLHADVLFCNPCLLIKSEKSDENILKQPEMNFKEKQQRTIENGDLNIADKGMFYIALYISSPVDSSKRFTLHPLADLFIPIQTRLL